MPVTVIVSSPRVPSLCLTTNTSLVARSLPAWPSATPRPVKLPSDDGTARSPMFRKMLPLVQSAVPCVVEGPLPARYTWRGSVIVPSLKSTVFETLKKRKCSRTVTDAMMSTRPSPCASKPASSPMPPNEKPKRRASTLALKCIPKKYACWPGWAGSAAS